MIGLFVVVVLVFLQATALTNLPRKKVLLIGDDELFSRSRTYSLEDFFWTGSGDGPLPPPEKTIRPIVRTTTVLATVFLDSPSSLTTDSSREEEDCLTECPINPATGEIYPTKVGSGEDNNEYLPDPKYWLLTVLRAPASPLPPSLSKSLAKLYQRAFIRQQEQHLGIVTTATVNRKKHSNLKPTLNLTRSVHNKLINRNSNISNIMNDVENFNEDVENVTIDNFNVDSKFMNNSIDVSTIQFENDTNSKPSIIKRSSRSINDELNIILLKNYTGVNISNALDLVKREIYGETGGPQVEVFLHNLSREGKPGDNDELKVVYWVSVGGRPVPAWTAARDMKLLADSEVVAELGYPITTKAEPYLKSSESPNGVIHASNARDIWIIIAGVILATIIVLCLISILACRLINRRKSSGTSRSSRTKKESLQDGLKYPEITGKDNKAYSEDDNNKKLLSILSPSEKSKEKDRFVTNEDGYIPASEYGMDNLTGSSSSSLSASELSQMTANLHQRQRMFEQQMQNEYATINKKNKSKHKRVRSKKVGVASEFFMSDSQDLSGDKGMDKFILSSPSSHSTSSCDSVIIRRPQGVISPTSYLSMPSVKSFPRGNAVEPLSRVLEPLSVKHLDLDSDSPVLNGRKKKRDKKSFKDDAVKTHKGFIKTSDDNLNYSGNLVRMGSMDKDPGVIGPMVWDLHRQRFEKESSEGDAASGTNISKMRQRFSELVDDAFSIFGSGNSSPNSSKLLSQSKTKVQEPHLPAIEDSKKGYRRHSAKEGISNLYTKKQGERPHTALPPRPPLPQNLNPSLAWGSTTYNTTMTRAISASGVRRPIIDVALVNSENNFPINDSANELIQSIRKELDKLPGTSDA